MAAATCSARAGTLRAIAYGKHRSEGRAVNKRRTALTASIRRSHQREESIMRASIVVLASLAVTTVASLAMADQDPPRSWREAPRGPGTKSA
jgi:hypothetical protein